MRISSRRLGEFLVARRVLSRDTLEEMLAREPSGGLSFSDLLVREGVVGEVDITAALASEVGVDFIDLTERSILPDAWAAVPEDLARAHLAVALERTAEGVLVALADPSDDVAIAEIETGLGVPVLPAVAMRADLSALIGQDRKSTRLNSSH